MYILTYLLHLAGRRTREVTRFSAEQEIPLILWKHKVHYRVYKFPPPIPLLSQINPVHAPHPTSWRYISILSSHLLLGLPGGFFPPVFPTKTLYAALLSPICATCTPHLILRSLITSVIFDEEHSTLSYSLYRFLCSVTSSLWAPNILLDTLFSHSLSLFSSLNVSDHVSHPYKITGKIIVLWILIFIFLGSRLEDKRFFTER